MTDGGRRRRPVAHALARAGWAIGALIVGSLFLLVYVVDQAGEDGFANTVVGGLMVLFPIGGLVGAGAGFLTQRVARGLLRASGDASSPTVSTSTTPNPLVAEASPYDGMVDPYRADYRHCRAAVERFRAIATSVPDGPAKEWLSGLATNLDAQLEEAARLARLCTALRRHRRGVEAAAVPAAQLKAAVTSFDATAARAGEIAVTLASAPEFEGVRAQLDMLASQAPALRTAPDPGHPA